jgi:hypothetical protein
MNDLIKKNNIGLNQNLTNSKTNSWNFWIGQSLHPFPIMPYLGKINKRFAMIRYLWQIPEEDTKTGFLPWSDEILRAIFTDQNGWSVRDYWNRATLGLISFDIDIYPWRIMPMQENGQQNDRGGCIGLLKTQAKEDGVSPEMYDQTIAFISPPPSNAGAAGNPGDALFDEDGYIEFYQHELGHVLGFQHSWGPADNNTYGAYNDDYDIMGYSQDQSHTIAPAPDLKWLQLNENFWISGRRLAAAALYRYVPAFTFSSSIIRLALPCQVQVTLKGLAGAALGQPILAVVTTFQGEIMIEYRPNFGDDLGVEPAVVIHSLDRRSVTAGASEVRPIFYEGKIPVPQGGVFQTKEKDVQVTCQPLWGIPEEITITIEAILNIDHVQQSNKNYYEDMQLFQPK